MTFKKSLSNILSAVIIATLLLTATPAQPASAAGFIEINSTADDTDNDGECTLREAITSANTDTASGAALGECAAGSGTDMITFKGSGIYNITLTSALPQISTEMTIEGSGQTITVSGENTIKSST